MNGPATGTAADLAGADAVSLDCFGTLVDAERPADPWTAVADALASRGVDIPPEWESLYRSSHADLARLEAQPLAEHVRAALAAGGVECEPATARVAVFAAFDGPVCVRDGARRLVAALDVPVAVVSNCAVSDLVDRTLERAALAAAVDVVVTSVDCGRLKPHPRPFEVAADRLDVPLADLVHVGDEAAADGAAKRAGATAIVLDDVSLTDLVAALEGSPCR
ncbi:MAG: HAD family hydrolase [Haloarculaceae archaeon]